MLLMVRNALMRYLNAYYACPILLIAMLCSIETLYKWLAGEKHAALFLFVCSINTG